MECYQFDDEVDDDALCRCLDGAGEASHNHRLALIRSLSVTNGM